MGTAEAPLIFCFLNLMTVAYVYSSIENVLFRISQSKNFKHSFHTQELMENKYLYPYVLSSSAHSYAVQGPTQGMVLPSEDSVSLHQQTILTIPYRYSS